MEAEPQRLLEELLADEATYGSLLHTLCHSFYRPLLANPKLMENPGRAEAEIMFHRVEELLAFHVSLFSSLQNANVTWPQTSISSVFLQAVPKMDVFTEAIRQHSASLHAIRTAKKETEAKHGDVTALIKASHHRIPTYAQFLSALSGLGKENEPDLEEAVVHLNRLQYAVETSKRFSRDQGKVLELEAKLEIPASFNQGLDRFSLAQTGRTLIREGVLAPTAQRGLTTGWPGMDQHQFFLFNDILLCVLKTTRAFKEVLKVQNIIQLHTIHKVSSIPDTQDAKNGFQICATTGEWTLYATSPAERKGWMDNLKYYAHQCKKYKTYGLAIEELMERERSECRPVPVIMEQILATLRADPTLIRTEGLFRLTGSVVTVKQLAHKIDVGEALEFNNIETHALAGLLKLWLRSLPEPLLTFELYQSFIDAVSGADQNAVAAALKDVVAQLPIYNKYTLRHLIAFLKEVTSHSDVNKMVSSNMAIVFGPNLLMKRGASAYDCSDVHLQQAVVKNMIDNYDSIFAGIEQEESLFVAQIRIVNEEKQRLVDKERRESVAARPSLSMRITSDYRVADDFSSFHRSDWETAEESEDGGERERARTERQRETDIEIQQQQQRMGMRQRLEREKMEERQAHEQTLQAEDGAQRLVNGGSAGEESTNGRREEDVGDGGVIPHGEDATGGEAITVTDQDEDEEEMKKHKKKIRLKNRLAEVDEVALKGKERRRRGDKKPDSTAELQDPHSGDKCDNAAGKKMRKKKKKNKNKSKEIVNQQPQPGRPEPKADGVKDRKEQHREETEEREIKRERKEKKKRSATATATKP